MTKEAALFAFFSSFDTPAYASTSVPDNAEDKMLTYTAETAFFGAQPSNLTVNIYSRGDSETWLNRKVQELSERIGRGGVRLHCDGGYIQLMRGSPWSIPLVEQSDYTIKRRQINVTALYFTTN